MSVRDTRAGMRQAIFHEQNEGPFSKVCVELESVILFYSFPFLVWYTKRGGDETGIAIDLLAAIFQNIKWLVVVGLAGLFLPMLSRKFRFFIAAISCVAAPIISGVVSWNLFHDVFWTLLIAAISLFIIGSYNANCLLWHEDMVATDVPLVE